MWQTSISFVVGEHQFPTHPDPFLVIPGANLGDQEMPPPPLILNPSPLWWLAGQSLQGICLFLSASTEEGTPMSYSNSDESTGVGAVHRSSTVPACRHMPWVWAQIHVLGVALCMYLQAGRTPIGILYGSSPLPTCRCPRDSLLLFTHCSVPSFYSI